MRRAARVDHNQTDIVNAYRRAGCSVAITSQLGKGFPDIVVGKYSLSSLVEIKDGQKSPSSQKLTEDEARFHSKWKGDIRIVSSPCEALEHVQELQERAGYITDGRLKKAMQCE